MIFKKKLSKENWVTKYQYGQETPLQTFIRVSYAVAKVEAEEYGASEEEVQAWADKFLKVLVAFKPCEDPEYTGDDLYVDLDGNRLIADGLKSTPGGRITSNAGTAFDKATLLNCFINSPATGGKIQQAKAVPNTDEIIDCSMDSEQTPDNLTNIFLSLLEAAETLKSEGGYGINFGFIRPRGTLIEGVGIRHPGVVSYMHVWDKMSEMIVKGDDDGYEDTITNHISRDTQDRIEKVMPRKGAMMGVLPIWHPDIEEFVRAKQEDSVLTKFNISVLVDDAFMEAVENDEMYDLHFDGKVYKRVEARELYDLMMDCTYCRAEPGVLFFDNMNRYNPILYLGPISASNPCVTEDTWVHTEQGPRQVGDLVGEQFQAIVNGEVHSSTAEGFWKTGTKDVFEVQTDRGYSVKATDNHLLPKVTNQTAYVIEHEWTPVSDLEMGDEILLSNHRESESWEGPGTFEEGWLLGSLVGDGTNDRREQKACLDYWGKEKKLADYAREYLNQSGCKVDYVSEDPVCDKVRIASQDLYELADEYGITPDSKQPTVEVEKASSEFQRGFLRGFFDADGSVQGVQQKGVSVRLSQSNRQSLKTVQRMLSRFGVVSTLYEDPREAQSRMMPDGNGDLKSYDCKAQHDLVISCDNMQVFASEIGFEAQTKRQTLEDRLASYKRSPNRERFVAEVVDIEPAGNVDVYDVSVPGVNEFDANGIRAHNCGEIGGTSFIDQGYEPADYLKPYMEDVDEHLIGFTTVCLLGSVNVTQYVREDRTFDYEQYREDIGVLARFLENVNDAGRVPLPAYQWALENIRQYGMGLNGLASTHFMLGLRYGSDEGIEFTEKIQQIKDDETLRISALLAKERGPFPMFDERYLETPYFQKFCTASEETKELVRKHGVRNAKRLTNPPLGNSSVICNMVSNGIDPVFDFGYNRTYIVDQWPEGLNQDNVKDILEEQRFGDSTAWRGEYEGDTYHYEPHNRGLCRVEPVEDYGYSWVKEHYPEDIENDAEYLVTTRDLTTSDHVRVQQTVQAAVDQSVSKTINLPNDYPFEDFKDLYFKAWKSNLVGVTTYRAGTMENVLESDDGSNKRYSSLLKLYRDQDLMANGSETTDEGVIISDLNMPDLYYNGPTKKVKREGNKYYIHFSYLTEHCDYPVALWIHSNDYEEGEYVTLNRAFRAIRDLLTEKGVNPPLVMNQVEKVYEDAYHVKLGKIISMALRHNIALTDIVATISDIEGDYVATTLAAVRKFLIEQIEDGTKAKGLECASCGSDQIVFESGCDRCLSCGYSACSG